MRRIPRNSVSQNSEIRNTACGVEIPRVSGPNPFHRNTLRIAKRYFVRFGTDIAYDVGGNCALRMNGAAAIWGLAAKTRQILFFSDVLIF